jgi:hypothetical protein
LRGNFVSESVGWKDIRVIREDQEECHRLLSKFNPADKAPLRWQVICLTGDMKLAPRFASLAYPLNFQLSFLLAFSPFLAQFVSNVETLLKSLCYLIKALIRGMEQSA